MEACALCSENNLVKQVNAIFKQIEDVTAGLRHFAAYTDIGTSELMKSIIRDARFPFSRDNLGRTCIVL